MRLRKRWPGATARGLLEEAKTETRGFGNRADAERIIEDSRVRAAGG